MSDSIDRREYGKLEMQVQYLEQSLLSMQSDIKAIRDLMEQGKGGWKTLVWLGGAAASMGAFISWITHSGVIK